MSELAHSLQWREEVDDFLAREEAWQATVSELATDSQRTLPPAARRQARRKRMRKLIEDIRPKDEIEAHTTDWYKRRKAKKGDNGSSSNGHKDPNLAPMPFAKAMGARITSEERAKADAVLRAKRDYDNETSRFESGFSKSRYEEVTNKPLIDRRATILEDLAAADVDIDAAQAVGYDPLRIAEPYRDDFSVPPELVGPEDITGLSVSVTGFEVPRTSINDSDEDETGTDFEALMSLPSDEVSLHGIRLGHIPDGFHLETESHRSAGTLAHQLEIGRLANTLAAIETALPRTAFDLAPEDLQ